MISKYFFILILADTFAVTCSYLTQKYKWYVERGTIKNLFNFVLLLPYLSLFDSFWHPVIVGRLLLQRVFDVIRFNDYLWELSRKPETKFHFTLSLFMHTRAYTIITQTFSFPCMNQIDKDVIFVNNCISMQINIVSSKSRLKRSTFFSHLGSFLSLHLSSFLVVLSIMFICFNFSSKFF